MFCFCFFVFCVVCVCFFNDILFNSTNKFMSVRMYLFMQINKTLLYAFLLFFNAISVNLLFALLVCYFCSAETARGLYVPFSLRFPCACSSVVSPFAVLRCFGFMLLLFCL